MVVRTARGTEFGIAASEVIEVSEEQVRALKSALRPVERIATEEDIEQAAEMERASAEALPVFKEMAREYHEDMHPVSVEFLLDGDKAVFYFEAEERIDFRELVRKLAARFHVRIDMRQIGVRDEACMVGGIGHCGQELCCKRLGGEFCPVSIRMAKEQGLSLNPQKISGLCGRLMCCLRYEFDAYKDFKGRAPKLNATVQTPAGPAKVVDHDVPREIVSLKVEGEKPVKVPLSDFDPAPEGATRPNAVGRRLGKRRRAIAGSSAARRSSSRRASSPGPTSWPRAPRCAIPADRAKDRARRGARAAAAPRAAGAAARARRGLRRRLRPRPPRPASAAAPRSCRRPTTGAVWSACPPPARRARAAREPHRRSRAVSAPGRPRGPRTGRDPRTAGATRAARAARGKRKGPRAPRAASLRPGRRQVQGRLAAAGPEVLGAAGRAG
ncbi:MAG: stage 0 sporulation family protein [Adlercreutzia equolifaciens]